VSESRALRYGDELKICRAVRGSYFQERNCVAQFNRVWSHDSAEGKHPHSLPFFCAAFDETMAKSNDSVSEYRDGARISRIA
jgi:hypothetical protein